MLFTEHIKSIQNSSQSKPYMITGEVSQNNRVNDQMR